MELKKTLAYISAVVAMMCWASTFVWTKEALSYSTPLTILFLRLLISAIMLRIYAIIAKKTEVIKKEHRKLFLLMSFFEPFCYFIGETFGMLFLSATLASIIISTIPLVTPVFSRIFLKEKITLYGVIGLIISFVGVSLIVANQGDNEVSLKGILLMFFAVLSGTSYGIVLRKISFSYSSVTIVGIQSFLGMLYFLPLFLIFDFSSLITNGLPLIALSHIFKLALIGSTLAFIFFTISARHIGINNANIFTNLIPVFTAIAAYFILGEVLELKKITGILIVIGGLFISQYPNLSVRKIYIKEESVSKK
ncbi:MAG: DMT family transporter [Candidatus Cloacimonetes bacterium]|nr:DMT family transporter [Candidatus Cloacimonadota bacterium]